MSARAEQIKRFLTREEAGADDAPLVPPDAYRVVVIRSGTKQRVPIAVVADADLFIDDGKVVKDRYLPSGSKPHPEVAVLIAAATRVVGPGVVVISRLSP